VISFDILSYFDQSIQVDVLMTVGSQVALFEEMALYRARRPDFMPNPASDRVPRPANVKRWLNVLDRNDIFGFRAEGVFEGLKDFQYETGYGAMSAHSGYFRRPSFYERLGEWLAGGQLMTTVYTSQEAARDPRAVGTHVLIVGVGEYPSLLGGDPTRSLDDPMSLKQLSSPPESAKALASWFLGRQGGASPAPAGFHNPGAPLVTVEMLLSPGQTYTRPDGTPVPVEAATRANIARRFDFWSERAAAHADNVAVFYFCGHGVMGANDYLLPADFGVVSRRNPWADAIDISETARAMRRLGSGPLYFFHRRLPAGVARCAESGRRDAGAGPRRLHEAGAWLQPAGAVGGR
jgi:hypothetical protein